MGLAGVALVIGIFGYELGADLETVPPPATRDLPVPDMEVGFYDLVVGWDRLEGRCWISSAHAMCIAVG